MLRRSLDEGRSAQPAPVCEWSLQGLYPCTYAYGGWFRRCAALMQRIRLYVALGITGLWAITYVVAVFEANYVGFTIATPVMLLAGGYLLGSGMRGDK